MNIGSLYRVKQYSWLLFPTKDISAQAKVYAAVNVEFEFNDNPSVVMDGEAAYLSRELNCHVSWFALDSFVVLLEEDGIFKRFLTADGKVGWVWFDSWNNESCFEEVKS